MTQFRSLFLRLRLALFQVRAPTRMNHRHLAAVVEVVTPGAVIVREDVTAVDLSLCKDVKYNYSQTLCY